MAVSFCGRRLLITRNNLFKTQKRNGYIVLLPEIGEDLTEKNPLLSEETKLPDFKKVTIERCIAAVNKQTVDFEQGIKSLEKKIEKKENSNIIADLINPLEELEVPLESTWGVTKALCFGDKRRMPTQCYENIDRRVRTAYSYKHCSKSIFQACKTALENQGNKFTKEQERLLSKFILEGRLNGLDIKTKKVQDNLSYTYEEIGKQQKLFRERLEAATKMYSQIIEDREAMRDFPEEFLKRVAADPNHPRQGPWKITLQSFIASTFLEYCSDRSLRKDLWKSKVLRCSLYGDRHSQNSTPLENIRGSRNEVAQALGYKSFAHMSMETKMAGSLENVYDVFETLRQTALPAQDREIAELYSFAKERGFEGDRIRQWDISYWLRKQRRAIFQYEENVVQEYFPLPKVLEGLFKLAETLFHIKIVEGPKPSVWHEDVRFFNVCDLDNSDVEPIASFYFDPYLREDKMHEGQHDGWMIGIRNRSKVCDTNPLAAMVFNFQSPEPGKPSLLTFEDVEELFRKFGKGFQHLLTTVNYTELAGLSNVEWDSADVSAHFMANWVYEPSIISEISGHYETGKPLPQETIENLKNFRTHMAGYRLCEKLYLSHFDLELHEKPEFWVQVMNRLWRKYFVIPEFKEDSHVCSFSEIFSGSMGAAYYSYLWSEMIGADVFSAFQEIPAGDKAQQKIIGRRYRDTFLALGGSCSSNEIFRRFRGRDPSAKALLKNLGLKAVTSEKQIKA